MPLPVYHLRRLVAATAVLLTLVVAGMYFYARYRATDVLKALPGKMGVDIKKTASGFQISKSDGKHTLFTIQASDVKQFKLNGNAELHNVSIVLYGRDSSRYDQIYGEDFAYNQKTGDVTANGDVQIDLVANPAGLASPDQATPKQLKNAIHLKTRNLVFNKDTGNAFTDARVEFRTPQASGWALGVQYSAKDHALILASQLHLTLIGPGAAVIEAQSGLITNEPRKIVLEHPHVARQGETLSADRATFYLSPENHVERVLAAGEVIADTHMGVAKRAASISREDSAESPAEIHGRADEAEFLFVPDEDSLRTATLAGKVHFEQIGSQPMFADAGRVILDFAGQNELQKVHAVDGAQLRQKAAGGNSSSNKIAGSSPQDFQLTAPVIDFSVAKGHILRRAITSGPAQITIVQANGSSPIPPSEQTVVTAARFDAEFEAVAGHNRLARIHGAPDARIVNSTAGQPDRVSTSDSVDASFLPQGGLEFFTQTGNVHYTDGQAPDKRMQAWANSARYTPADQMLLLNGDPRIINGGMATTARTMRMNRATGDALAEGDVKSTYSELKEQPSGALLASSSPIHVTASSMTAHSSPAVALYSGNGRLWQDANMIEAPSIQFDRDRRSVVAQGTAQQPVRTSLVQPQKPGAEEARKAPKAGSLLKKTLGPAASMPISITSLKLTYADSERRIHYEGGVVAKATEFTASASTVDAYLLPHSQTSMNQSLAGPGQLDHMVAEGGVIIQQPNRRAEGQKLIYTASDDKFVLTGGPPSIFDAEHGKITGVSLTFFRRDDRVLVEGEASTPVVTQTRVAR